MSDTRANPVAYTTAAPGVSGTNPANETTTTHSGATGTHSGDTKTATGNSAHQSHAKGEGAASIVPQKLQEKLPESLERTVPTAIHDTGRQGGLQRKQK